MQEIGKFSLKVNNKPSGLEKYVACNINNRLLLALSNF